MKKLYIIFAALALIICSCTKDIEQDGAIPKVITLEAKAVTRSTAVLCGKTEGAVENMLTRGVCFSTKENVSREDAAVTVVRGQGEFEARTYELDPLTKYYIKAFAVMKDGSVIYGELKDFSTPSFALPSLKAEAASNILAKEATLNATIESEGDYESPIYGFVYGKEQGVDIDNPSCLIASAQKEDLALSKTISSLEIGTRYYYKAFARAGEAIAYSDESYFETINAQPAELAEITVEDNQYTSLSISSSIINAHGVVSECGFCWSLTNEAPGKEDNFALCPKAAFEHTITGLSPNQELFIRAYAINDAGINYSAVAQIRVKSYNCCGNMAVVVPLEEFYIGYLGDPEETTVEPIYLSAHDGLYSVYSSANINTTPSKVVNLAPYRISKYEVTYNDYVEFLNIYQSPTVKDGENKGQRLLFIEEGGTDISFDAVTNTWKVAEDLKNHPVTGVTWYGAAEFCRFFGGFLPNEAQWENAARGNVYSNDPEVEMYKYSGSHNIADVAVYNQVLTSEVGTKQPNQLGIYDMTGNAQEWTSSSWVREYKAIYADAPNSATKVCRGCRCQRGAVQHFLNSSREGFSAGTFSANKSNYLGFRFCDSLVE